MKTLNTTGLKVLKVIHLVCAVMWMGGAIGMMVLLFHMPEENASEMYATSMALKLIDDYPIILGANGCLLTGLLYGIFTKWGFFRHRWLILKWIFTLFMILSGTFIMGPCVNGNAAHATDLAFYLSPESDFWPNLTTILHWGLLQNILLLITIIVSVFKPWKKKL
ncbi:MAG: hypothetical protein J6C87_04635 [Bacteroides sp.]|nr:hypothetical protein [Bacteroides sp.]